MKPIAQTVDSATFEGGDMAGKRLQAFRHLGPNWYAAVMGISIVPGAGVTLFPSIMALWQTLWITTTIAFAMLLIARLIHLIWHWDQAQAHILDPSLAPYYACKSIAFLAVGLLTYSVGKSVLGEQMALDIDLVLFTVGSIIGLIVSAAVISLMIISHDLELAGPSPVWLLPAMGPMVSAAFAAPILEHMAPGGGRQLLTLCLYGLVGLDFLVTMIVFPMVLQRLFLSGPLPLPLTPSLFLGLAPFGQAVNAVGNLADTVPGSGLPSPFSEGFVASALVFGVPVMGFTLLWLATSLVLLVRALRRGLRFSMVWWAFGFPLGTVVTGMSAIARHTGLSAFHWATVVIYALLCLLVGVTTLCTLKGLLSGELPAAPVASPKPAARPAGVGRA